MDDKPRINRRRIGLQIAFWFVLIMLLSTVVSQVVNIGNEDGQSAYDDDWDDMSAFRQDINDMGIETKSLVSSPLLLADIEDPCKYNIHHCRCRKRHHLSASIFIGWIPDFCIRGRLFAC